MNKIKTTFKSKKTISYAGVLTAIFWSVFLAWSFPESVRMHFDLWFGADTSLIISNMVDPNSINVRSILHPLFALITFPIAFPISLIGEAIGASKELSQIISTQLIIALSGGATWLLIYIIFLKIGLDKFQSFCISLIFLSSTSFIFWWSTTETFPLGASTLLLPVFLLANRCESRINWLLALIASASITVSNYTAGLISAGLKIRLNKTYFILILTSILCTSTLFAIQKKYILSSMGIDQIFESEKRFIKSKYKPFDYMVNFFVFPIVAPSTPELVSQSYLYTGKSDENAPQQLNFSVPGIKEISLLRICASITWLGFLAKGLYNAVFTKRSKVSIALTCILGFQFLMHFIYGDTPFLYSAHYVPVMVILSGYAIVDISRKRSRNLMTFIVAIICLICILNVEIFAKSHEVGISYISSIINTE